jgi:S-adenosylmethionine:diacylglycerol 3-amino-3-carboxypropyl transferase
MMADTVWKTGRFNSALGTRRLLFGEMYEDVEIERAAFTGKNRVFCIASAGTTAIALAENHDVVACDINPVQLAYAERRAHGAEKAIGDAERIINLLRRFMPLVGWSRNLVHSFLELSDVDAQIAFWHDHLDTTRFRMGFDALMSRVILRIVYSPQLLSQLPPDFGEVLRRRLERGFSNHPNATNPYARALLEGEPSNKYAPPPRKIEFVTQDAAGFLESYAPQTFDAFALSNILDGADSAYRARLSNAVRRTASAGAVVVLRSFAEPPADLKTNQAERDRSMLWGIVDIRPAEAF